MHRGFAFMAGLALAVWMSGCVRQAAENSPAVVAPDGVTPAVDGGPYLLVQEPAEALDVMLAREQVSDGEEVVVSGRIGGSGNPWIDGRAAFSIVDPSLKACNQIPGDTCPQPWDYCCERTDLPRATALVKVVDADGQLVKADARQLLGVQELSTVVVRGRAQRDEAGNLTVLASGVHVKPESSEK